MLVIGSLCVTSKNMSIYCWSGKTLIMIHWTHLSVTGIRGKCHGKQIPCGPLSLVMSPYVMFLNAVTVMSS